MGRVGVRFFEDFGREPQTLEDSPGEGPGAPDRLRQAPHDLRPEAFEPELIPRRSRRRLPQQRRSSRALASLAGKKFT
jgi:hypothetical protein